MSTLPASQGPSKILQTRDQRRASLVYEHTRSIENAPFAKKYGSLVLASATMFRQCGLVQAIAFYEAKAEEHHKKFVDHLQHELTVLGSLSSGKGLRDHAMHCDLAAYMRLTREALALCQWHKRFAQSILKVQPGEE